MQAYRSRLIFPPQGPPIEHGFVSIGDDGVTISQNLPDVAPNEVLNLGQVAVIPGLVNAHTHLEFSDLEEPLGEPGTPLCTWIMDVVASRRAQASGDKRQAIRKGLGELKAAGTVAVGEIATLPLEWDWYNDDDVDTVLLLERLSLDPGRMPTLVEEASAFLRDAEAGQQMAGFSPHAPYSVHPNLLESLCQRSKECELPLAMHLAESWEEMELLQSGCGAMEQMLIELGAWNPAAIPRGIEMLHYLQQLSTAHHALVIHGNYFGNEELEFLAEHRDRMTLVYCPRTHHFFEQGEHPVGQLIEMGGSVALGTDSRASNPDLSVFEEAKFVAAHYPQIDPQLVLEMATTVAAKALGIPWHDTSMSFVRLPEDCPADPYEALFSGTVINPDEKGFEVNG